MAAGAGRPPMISLAEHPRAGLSIRRLKAWGGLAGFGIAALASVLSGVGITDAALRGLVAGIGSYFLAWTVALAVWRALVQAEARAAIERARSRRAVEAQRQAERQAARQAAASSGTS